MRAWHVTAHGEPIEVMQLAEVPDPVPSDGEVLVRVRAVSANFPDVLLARGEYQVKPEIPFSPGIELAGVVEAIGAGVTNVVVGQRIVAFHIGVLSELAVVPVGAVLPAPEALSDAEASGLMIAYQTAYFALHRRAQIQPGEWLLVHAAAGGVGAASIQLGVAAGARVIAVVGDERKAEVAREQGAELVLFRGVDDIPARVRETTGGHGVDVVVDPVGGAAFDASVRCIAFEGRLVVIGFASGEIATLKTNLTLIKNFSVEGLYWGMYAEKRPELVLEAHIALTQLAADGKIKPVIDEIVPFEQAPVAIQKLAGGSTVGRVVIEVGS